MADLPRALRALGNAAVVTEAGPHPREQLEPALSGGGIVLAGRATRVPQAAVTSGMWWTVTVTTRAALGGAHGSDLG
jgi:hypothetical protein